MRLPLSIVNKAKSAQNAGLTGPAAGWKPAQKRTSLMHGQLPAGVSVTPQPSFQSPTLTGGQQTQIPVTMPGITGAAQQPFGGLDVGKFEDVLKDRMTDFPKTAEQTAGMLLPNLLARFFQDIPEISLPSFEATPESALANIPGFIDTAQQTFGGQFDPFKTAQFREVGQITPGMLADLPAIQAYEAELGAAGERQLKGLAEQMASRGMLSSGATLEGATDIGERLGRAAQSNVAALTSPLIQESIRQQAFGEPLRRQAFDEANLARQYGRMTDIAGAEHGILAGQEQQRAGQELADFQRLQAWRDREALFPALQGQMTSDILSRRLADIGAVTRGTSPIVSSAMSAAQNQALAQAQQDAERNQLISGAISGGMGLLGSLAPLLMQQLPTFDFSTSPLLSGGMSTGAALPSGVDTSLLGDFQF